VPKDELCLELILFMVYLTISSLAQTKYRQEETEENCLMKRVVINSSDLINLYYEDG
jgi:hypothetical protein